MGSTLGGWEREGGSRSLSPSAWSSPAGPFSAHTTSRGPGSYGSDLSTTPAVLRDGTILWPGPDATLLAVSPRGRVLWRLRLDQQATSPAVTTSGDVVVGDHRGRLTAMRPTPRGASVLWQVDLGAATYGSPVWSPDGRTVYQTLTAGVVAVSGGRVRWRSRPASEIIEVSPAVAPRLNQRPISGFPAPLVRNGNRL